MEKWKQTQEISKEIFAKEIFGEIFAQEIFEDIFAQEIGLLLQPHFVDGVVQELCNLLNWNNNVPTKSNYA